MSGQPGQEGVRVEPGGGSLAGVARGYVEARRAREGGSRGEDLSVTRIWTGHQAEFWHPGIMAKYIAASEIAARLKREGAAARVTWLVVDQDANEPWRLAYPAIVKDVLTRAVWALPFTGAASATRNPFAAETPACALPPLRVAEGPRIDGLDAKPSHGFVERGLLEIAGALRRHEAAPNAARQVMAALCDLLAPWCRPDEVVYGSELSRGAAFGALVEEIRRDPARCVGAYNRAAAAVPGAHVRALKVDGSRVELPLWRLPSGAGRARRAVWSDELGGVRAEELAPRALFMTALVRSEMSDLFIHGTGGGVYDRITERWFVEWRPGVTLAPTAVVTATRHLPLGMKVRTPGEIARARWVAHSARHSPGMLGDGAGEHRRRELVEGIRTARRRGGSARDAYLELHRFLGEQRERNAERVRELEEEARKAARDEAVSRVVFDRAWPFPLYPREVLDGLKREVEAAVGGTAG